MAMRQTYIRGKKVNPEHYSPRSLYESLRKNWKHDFFYWGDVSKQELEYNEDCALDGRYERYLPDQDMGDESWKQGAHKP